MVRKTYKTFRLKGLTIPFNIDGKDVYVIFKSGCTMSSTATYTTTDERIQEALESLAGFNRNYYLDKVVELNAEAPKVAAPKVVKPEPEKEEEKEVVDMLDAKTFNNLVELRNALSDKGIDVSQITNVKAAENIAKKNGYNYTVEKKS
jgi:hypothetical protein